MRASVREVAAGVSSGSNSDPAAAQQQLLKQFLRPPVAGVAGHQLALVDRDTGRQQLLQQRQAAGGAVAGAPVEAWRRLSAGAQPVEDVQRQRETDRDEPEHIVQVLQARKALLLFRYPRGEMGFLPFEAAYRRAPGSFQVTRTEFLHPATVPAAAAAVNRRLQRAGTHRRTATGYSPASSSSPTRMPPALRAPAGSMVGSAPSTARRWRSSRCRRRRATSAWAVLPARLFSS